jgi:hypothetical protein
VDRSTVSKISKKVFKRFPEMTGIRPKVRRQSKPKNGKDQFLLTYQGQVELPGGRKMKRVVRVVVDASGRVIRMSTSR